jgi:hypothetical protein
VNSSKQASKSLTRHVVGCMRNEDCVIKWNIQFGERSSSNNEKNRIIYYLLSEGVKGINLQLKKQSCGIFDLLAPIHSGLGWIVFLMEIKLILQ